MWGVSGSVVALSYTKNIRPTSTDIKKTDAQAWAIQTIDFLGPYFKRSYRRSGPKKFS